MSNWWDADPVASGASVAPKGNQWWASDPVADKPSALSDVGKSIGPGLIRGAAGLVGLPEAVARYGSKGIESAANYVSGKLGYEPYNRGDKPGMVDLPSSEKLIKDYEAEAGPLYEPQTRAGKFARGAAEFIPGALAGPGGAGRGIAGVAGNVLKYGVVPGLASEGAGQLTEGTAAEPFARVGGALLGAGAAGMATRPSSAARTLRGQLPEGVTPQVIDQARALLDDAAQQGIRLTWPEALSQTAGQPVLSNLMRHIEAHPSTEARMAELFGQRPQQVENAGRQAMTQIAPPNAAPSTIGPAFGREAEGVVNDVRGTINRATEPFYQAAEAVPIPPADWQRVVQAPGWREARDAVRNDPQLNRYVSHLPDNSVGFVNEVKKFADQQRTNAASPLAQNPNMQRAAGYGRDADTFRQAGINASPDYEVALRVQEQTRRQFLEPILQGPLGKLADKDIATKKAINTLFPTKPLPTSEAEVETAVRAVAARSPRAAEDLVRAHTESIFNAATKDLQTGANQAGGAKFRAALVGDSQQRANFEAAVLALPHGQQRLDGFNRFLDVVEATGTRQNVGSRTAYNQLFNEDLSSSGVIGNAIKTGANPVRAFQPFVKAYERWSMGQNLNQLADILTNPQAVGHLRAIARMPTGSRQALLVGHRLLALSNSARAEPTRITVRPSDQAGQ